jgi:hypothetical protein
MRFAYLSLSVVMLPFECVRQHEEVQTWTVYDITLIEKTNTSFGDKLINAKKRSTNENL